MSGDIRYIAILEGSEFKAEVRLGDQQTSLEPKYRDVALSIAAQAQRGDVACVTTNQLTGYYIKRQDELTCVAVNNNDAPARVILSLLKKVDEKISNCRNSGASPNHQQILNESIEDISANRDQLQVAHSEIAHVKQIMVENIDRLLERGERVNLLVDRTGEMSQTANIFNRQATSLQRKMWFQNIKVVAVGGGLILGSLFIATVALR